MKLTFLWLSLPGLACGACSPSPPVAAPDPATVVLRGVVTYRPRLALPPGTRITVRLADVSRADEPATVIAQQLIQTSGEQVPIPFTLPVARDRLEPGRRYAVQVRVDQAGELWFLTTGAHRVDPARWPDSMEIVVEQVR